MALTPVRRVLGINQEKSSDLEKRFVWVAQSEERLRVELETRILLLKLTT